MKKIDEYLQHARDCTLMAKGAVTDEHRKLLQEMANTWSTLARERARMNGHPLPDDLTAALPKVAQAPALPSAPPKKVKAPLQERRQTPR